MKDVPVDFPEGLGLVTICEREDRGMLYFEYLQRYRLPPQGALRARFTSSMPITRIPSRY